MNGTLPERCVEWTTDEVVGKETRRGVGGRTDEERVGRESPAGALLESSTPRVS
jgi:hypothetical protein